MEYTQLGNSGIKVSRFCLGCMSFGDPASNMHAWTLDPDASETIIKHALDLGINFGGYERRVSRQSDKAQCRKG